MFASMRLATFYRGANGFIPRHNVLIKAVSFELLNPKRIVLYIFFLTTMIIYLPPVPYSFDKVRYNSSY